MKIRDFFKIFFIMCRILPKVRENSFQKEEKSGCRMLPKMLSQRTMPVSSDSV